MEGRNQMRKLSRRRQRVALVVAPLGLVMLVAAAVSLAEVVHSNTVVGDSQSATIPSGGSTDVNYWITQNGMTCDAADGGSAKVTFNLPAGVNASASDLTFSACAQNESDGAPGVKPVTFSSSAVGTHTITVSVTDTNDASSVYQTNSANFTLTVVADTPQNVNPTADAGGPYSGAEGSEITLNGSGSSDSDGTIASYAWSVAPQSGGGNDPDPGAGCSFKNGVNTGVSPVIICTDDGNYDVSLTVTDDDGATDNDTAVASVSNANPVIDSVGNDGPIDEGGSATINATSHDPGTNDTNDLSTSYDCDGNGTYEKTSGTCSFADNGTFAVGVKVSDGDGGSATSSTNVVVKNVAPTVGALTASGSGTACIGGNIAKLDFGFTDPGVNDDPWDVDIDWGDGETDTYNADSQGDQPQQQHTYAAGTYTIKVTVTDKDGDSGQSAGSDGGVSFLYNVSGILPPFNAAGTSNFKLGSTTPVKIKVLDCDGVSVSNLSPDVSLKKYDPNPDGDVNEVVSSSAADTGNQMRYDASGQQYIFNLSTKLSGFGIGAPLTPSPGTYEVKASDASFGSTSQKFDLKK
jgi:hypothetical protein